MTVFILGGGPTGLAVADGLVDNNYSDFTLIERSRNIGGMAQTLAWGPQGSHDLGPHKIFTLDEKLARRVYALLPEDYWLTREKKSTIFMNGHFLPYPPSPFSLAGVFGINSFVRMVLGYGNARMLAMLGSSQPTTFEEDIVHRLGKPLYNALFKPIALKLWGEPNQLDVKLSKGRVQTPSLSEVLLKVLKLKHSSEFEALNFRYPRGGLGRIWSAIEEKAQAKGKFVRGVSVNKLVTSINSIREIHTVTDDGKIDIIELSSSDFVASTLPLKTTISLMGSAFPRELAKAAEEAVVLNDLILIFLHIDKQELMTDSWVFVPDPEIIFHRLSEQRAFDPEMTPNGSIVCCEVMSNETRQLGNLDDSELTVACLKDLKRMGYSDFNVKTSRVIRLVRSYPVYKVGYEKVLSEVVSELDRYSNFKTLGRQGSFNYIGTLDAMDIGYGFATWLADGMKSWDSERKRTSHYPVLD